MKWWQGGGAVSLGRVGGVARGGWDKSVLLLPIFL